MITEEINQEDKEKIVQLVNEFSDSMMKYRQLLYQQIQTTYFLVMK